MSSGGKKKAVGNLRSSNRIPLFLASLFTDAHLISNSQLLGSALPNSVFYNNLSSEELNETKSKKTLG